jgi:hypothetical protein
MQPLIESIKDFTRSRPWTVVFANSDYGDVLENWLRHALPFVKDNLLVISLDNDIHCRSLRMGMRSALLPFEGMIEEMWLLRLEVFEVLVRHNVDFFHSDADAVWLADPRSYCLGLNVDLAISQGTVWPYEAVKEWSFVLCCGFFHIRASHHTAQFLNAVRKMASTIKDDQIALNRVLLTAGVDWQLEAIASDTSVINDLRFNNFETPVRGNTLSGFNLNLALLPQNLFQRIPREGYKPFIKHPMTPKTATLKITALRKLGCWFDSEASCGISAGVDRFSSEK